jgi:hypothetical protein
MIQKAFWCVSLLLVLFHVANAGEKIAPRHGLSPAPVHLGNTIYAPTPQYLILGQATGGIATPTIGQPYAYGWFGVSPRRHTISHRGYYGGYWLFPGRIAP